MFVLAYTHNLLANSLLQHFGAGFDQLVKPRELSLADGEYSDLLFSNDYNLSIWSERLIMRGESLEASSLFLSQLYRLLRSMNKRTLEKDYGQLFPNGLPNLDDIYFILEDAINWMVEQLASMPRPFLAYLHVLPPHEPYSPRREFIGIFKDGYQPTPKPERFFSQGHAQADLNQQRRAYDEYLAYADAEFGRLLDYLESSGLLNDTYVFVTSDHGEMFERGIRGHVTPTLYQPLLQVPLLVSKPGQNQREDVSSATSCVDVLPTILSIVGQPVPDWCEGEILPTFAGYAGRPQRTVYAVDAKRNAKWGALSRASVAAITEQHKLVTYFGYENVPEAYELFDLRNDPDELNDRYTTDNALARTLQGELQDTLNRINASALSPRS
jgi:arylsulfatase A-like enzyme